MSAAGATSAPVAPPRRYQLKGGEVQILQIEFVSQNPPSMFCVVASMKMCWDFIRATLGRGKGDAEAPDLPFETIRSLTRTDEHTGTILGSDLMAGFNASQSLVDARLEAGVGVADMKERVERGLPVIALYYPSVARDPQSEAPGASHACVFLGSTNLEVLIHNPWMGPYTVWPATDFDWSRKRLADYAIVFDVRPKRARQQTFAERGADP